MSELKTMLLHVDASANIGARLEWASAFARMHDAHLAVSYAVLPSALHPYALAGDGQAAAWLIEVDAEQQERAKAAFKREVARAGRPDALSWVEASGPPLQASVGHAWRADMLLLAQHDPSAQTYSGVPGDFASAVLLASGKPGLVMPYIGGRATLGQNVLVAWKPTPESARAVSAALPILQRAEQVHVVVWNESDGDEPALPDIDPYLRAHGVAPIVHRGGRPSSELGELLLSRAADLQADMLVMGCYGHGRAVEWVLGGVTRTILRSMTVPVLMAH